MVQTSVASISLPTPVFSYVSLSLRCANTRVWAVGVRITAVYHQVVPEVVPGLPSINLYYLVWVVPVTLSKGVQHEQGTGVLRVATFYCI